MLQSPFQLERGDPIFLHFPKPSLSLGAMVPIWNSSLIAVATTFHGLGILSTIFRLGYRWHTARIWWEDGWAVVALLADIMCLVTAWLEQPIPSAADPSFFITGNWILAFAFLTVLWTCRLSILVSMVRVSQPMGVLKWVARGVGVAFGVMWLGLMGLRTYYCIQNGCLINRPIGISLTITDSIADVLLTGLPILFLRNVKLGRQEKFLIFSAFSASMVINVLTIAQAVVLLGKIVTSGTIIVSHIKTALSLVVCNLLVLVTWVYGVLNKGRTALGEPRPDTTRAELTTIDLAQAQDTSQGLSSDPSAATKSSSWSFRGPGRSGMSSFATETSRTNGL